MQIHSASLINAIILIVFGTWGYFGSDNPSMTALIPVVFGVILLFLNAGLRKHNKKVAHTAVIMTLLVIIGLFMPLKGAIERNDMYALLRVAVMIVSSLAAMAFFIKSFVDARQKAK